MARSTTAMQVLGVLILVGGGFSACDNVKKVNPQITVTKILDLDQTGGRYWIQGTGYDGNEFVSLEIKNAPLKQPSSWHLGSAQAANGNFSFKTEDFRCVYVSDQMKRDQYKNQQLTFVAQGQTSHWSTSAVDTANGVLICP